MIVAGVVAIVSAGILAGLLIGSWRDDGGWFYELCSCWNPDPEGGDPEYLSRCRNCGLWWDRWNCEQPKEVGRA